MIINQFAIFNEAELRQAQLTLQSFSLLGDNVKKQLEKACEDYRFLTSSLPAKGLTQQVILFLLSPDSCTVEGIESFLDKLEIWTQIVDEQEQRLYADILGLDTKFWRTDEILSLRCSLIDILVELSEIKVPQDFTVPMHLQRDYPDYSTWMTEYGSEFYKSDSPFNQVPDTKGKVPDDAISYYLERFEVPN
jgi:hypothetical protein